MELAIYESPDRPFLDDKAITVHGLLLPGALLSRCAEVWDSNACKVQLRSRLGLVIGVYHRNFGARLDRVDVVWSDEVVK